MLPHLEKEDAASFPSPVLTGLEEAVEWLAPGCYVAAAQAVLGVSNGQGTAAA